MMGCTKCRGITGVLMLVTGILIAANMYGQQWSNFYRLDAFTTILIIWGLGALGSTWCKDCQACMCPSKKR